MPLAVELGVPVTLLEATGTQGPLPGRVPLAELGLPATVVHQRSEAYARGAGRDAFDLAARPGAGPPPVAIELCLPLVRPGGRLVLWTATLDGARAPQAVAGMLGGAGCRRSSRHRPGRKLVRGREAAPDAGAVSAPAGHGCGSVRWRSSTIRPHDLPRLRACEPEGRRRQDDDGDQHGCVRRRGGNPRAADRPRSSGQRHHRPRIPARRARAQHLRPAARRVARGRGRVDRRAEPVAGAVASRPGRGRRSSSTRATPLLRDILHGTGERYPYVFVDCPPSLGLLDGERAVGGQPADRARCSASTTRWKGLAQLLQSVELVRTRLNPRLGVDRGAADDVRQPHPPGQRRRQRGARAFRPAGVRDRGAAQHPAGRGAQPRSADHPVRCRALPGPTRTTESRWRSSSVAKSRGLGEGWRPWSPSSRPARSR